MAMRRAMSSSSIHSCRVMLPPPARQGMLRDVSWPTSSLPPPECFLSERPRPWVTSKRVALGHLVRQGLIGQQARGDLGVLLVRSRQLAGEHSEDRHPTVHQPVDDPTEEEVEKAHSAFSPTHHPSLSMPRASPAASASARS